MVLVRGTCRKDLGRILEFERTDGSMGWLGWWEAVVGR